MIGNDIVDLTAAKKESNWRRKGYAAKIFSAEEQTIIMNAEQPDQLVWLFWSMKEAAYKINSKDSGMRSYAPLQLLCKLQQLSLSRASGVVEINGICYHTSSTLNKHCIHTICAKQVEQLQQVNTKISLLADRPDFDYHATNPQCISHHGAYLALVYLAN